MSGIVASTQAYETWLRGQLGDETSSPDLARKRAKMAKNAFTFLRATYWRWAETVGTACPAALGGTPVLAVGDVHLENFGTWRDAEGRLVWGVNDYDEAAVMPWPLDLLRLATSALLVPKRQAGASVARDDAVALMAGYAEGISDPRPIVLDHDFAWLRSQVAMVEDEERSEFWAKMSPPAGPFGTPPPRILAALAEALPRDAVPGRPWPRVAGAGSLGRPRWVVKALWQGGPILREAKAVLPSAWAPAGAQGPSVSRLAEAARGPYRAPDPHLLVRDAVAVRRLSPNNRKIEAKKAGVLVAPEMLHAMGRDLAAVHAGTAGAQGAILQEIRAGAPFDAAGGWLARNAQTMAGFVARDQGDVPGDWAAPDS
ncbi:DUF2252 family protein [Siccirubricoccus sp. G192]|uniref:DUF2252 family protein n=1 Tax=Siccirubricoccus sp. G192 TaxID=2849651 RepID=UPI001C2BEFD4|nr:DUF2252 family protein [Siccirubricoccus sp. G192]MBV1798226.1 DUF2252 domain-containing protein [Siccirubricoccus sp. G192]